MNCLSILAALHLINPIFALGLVRGVLPNNNVDMVIDFNSGSPGDLISVANLTASTHVVPPTTGTWSLPTRTPLDHTYTISSTSLPLLSPIICNGTVYTSTPGRAIKFDADHAVVLGTGYEQELYTFGANSVTTVSLGAMTTFASTLNTEADMFILYSPFSVTQFHYSNGSTPYINAHSQYSSGSVIGNSAQVGAGPYWISQRANNATGLTEVIVQDGVTGAFVGCSRTHLDPWGLVSLEIGDYLMPLGGSFKHSIIALGFGVRATLPLLGGNFVLTAPATAVASDSPSNISLDFGGISANALAFAYKIERSTDGGSTWSTIQSDLEVPFDNSAVSPYLDSTVSNGITYTYRITSLLNAYSSTPTVSNSVTHSNSGAWTDAIDPASAPSTDDWDYGHYQSITLPAGTVTKLRAYISEVAIDVTTKLALFDSTKHLVTSGSIFHAGDASGPQYLVANVTPTVITAGTYYIGWFGNATAGFAKFLGGSGTYKYDFTNTYASFPMNPFVEDGSISRTYACSAWIQ